MTIAAQKPLLTYEVYLAEPVTSDRYEILDGVKRVANPTRRHQQIQKRCLLQFTLFQDRHGLGEALGAPCDILITKVPLRTRQPDVLFISHARLAQNAPADDPAPLTTAPELVVEILSPSDTKSVLHEKLMDYRRVGVRECWIVRPSAETVEVLRLTPDNADIVALYTKADTAQSVTFPDLSIPVANLFAA